MNNFYFRHDNDAREDEDILPVRMKYGWAGYGLYWALVERLHQGDGVVKYDPTALAFSLQCDQEILQDLCENFKVFKVNEDGYLVSDRLLRDLQERRARLEQKRKAGRKGAANRWQNDLGGDSDGGAMAVPKQNDGGAMAVPKQSDGTSMAEDGKGKERKGKEKDKPSLQFDEKSIELRVSRYLLKLILEFNPSHQLGSSSPPNLQKWADHVRLMRQRDKRTEQQIAQMLEWLFHSNHKQAHFWRKQVQSTDGLRKKWDKIYPDMMEAKQPSLNSPSFQGNGAPPAGAGEKWYLQHGWFKKDAAQQLADDTGMAWGDPDLWEHKAVNDTTLFKPKFSH